MPKKSKSTSPDTDLEDPIRQRAYQLWEADGRPEGRAEHYWQLAQSAQVPEKLKRKGLAKASAPAAEKKPRKAAKAE